MRLRSLTHFLRFVPSLPLFVVASTAEGSNDTVCVRSHDHDGFHMTYGKIRKDQFRRTICAVFVDEAHCMVIHPLGLPMLLWGIFGRLSVEELQ